MHLVGDSEWSKLTDMIEIHAIELIQESKLQELFFRKIEVVYLKLILKKLLNFKKRELMLWKVEELLI